MASQREWEIELWKRLLKALEAAPMEEIFDHTMIFNLSDAERARLDKAKAAVADILTKKAKLD